VVYRSIIYVALQFACSALLVLSMDRKSIGLMSVTVSVAGLVLGVRAIVAIRVSRLSVMPEVKVDSQLVTIGPFSQIRHPMYSGLILFTGGFVLTPFHAWKLMVWCLLILILRLKAGYEESQLQKQFPDYEKYRSETRRFIPFVY
jgi:protein-S-isoprenylcysteine O-methyltransferase Ste14